MNDINTRLVQHLATNNLPLPPHLLQKMRIDLIVLANQATRILRVAVKLVRGIQLGAVHTDRQVCTPDVEGVPSCRNLDHQNELKIQWAKKLGEGEDLLAETTRHTYAVISPQPKNLKTQMLRSMPSILARMP